jgi:mono/diheme cytochrome c family protein
MIQCPTTLSVLLLALGVASAPVEAADVVKGRKIFAQHCAGCHGAGGVPVMPGAPNLTRPEATMRPDGALAAAIRNGRATMPGFRGLLQESEVYDVIAFMRTLLR